MRSDLVEGDDDYDGVEFDDEGTSSPQDVVEVETKEDKNDDQDES